MELEIKLPETEQSIKRPYDIPTIQQIDSTKTVNKRLGPQEGTESGSSYGPS